MNISNEAVDAAYRTLPHACSPDDARAALEAAAPHMLAMAWGEGFNGGISGSWPEDNPYRSES